MDLLRIEVLNLPYIRRMTQFSILQEAKFLSIPIEFLKTNLFYKYLAQIVQIYSSKQVLIYIIEYFQYYYKVLL